MHHIATRAMTDALPEPFARLVRELTDWLADRPVVPELRAELEAAFPSDGAFFSELRTACMAGIDSGRLADRGAPPLRYGRIVKPSSSTSGYSIDVVTMTDVVGPHHAHPKGEIDMVMPIDAAARFDGHGIGWLVFGPGSDHSPTVTGGTAAILYALPDGAIRF